MVSSKSCMTHEHRLKLQQNWMHKQCANESFIEYECRLNKQNNYAGKKYVKDSLVTWQQWLEELKIYIQNQCVTKNKKEIFRRLHM